MKLLNRLTILKNKKTVYLGTRFSEIAKTLISLVEWLRQMTHDLKVQGSIPHKGYHFCRNHMLDECRITA